MKKIFLSYSHDDSRFKDEFLKHLAPLQRTGIAEVWHDRELFASDLIEPTIAAEIEESDIFVALVSSSYFASEFCWSKELLHAIRQAGSGRPRVVGVIVRDVHFAESPFAHTLLLPKDAKAVSGTEWKNHDQAWTNVVSELGRLCKQLDQASTSNEVSIEHTPTHQQSSPQRSPKQIRVRVIQPELVRPEGLAELVGILEVEFLGEFDRREECDLQLFVNPNLTSRLLTETASEAYLEFEPRTEFPGDRLLRPRYGRISGANSVVFRSLPVGEIRRRHGNAVARVGGIRVNANQLWDRDRVVIALRATGFEASEISQTDLAYFAPRTEVFIEPVAAPLQEPMSVHDFLSSFDYSDQNALPLLAKIRFTSYFGRWEVPGAATRVCVRIGNLPDCLLSVYSTGVLNASDGSISARLLVANANGGGFPLAAVADAQLLDAQGKRYAAHVERNAIGTASVWDIGDAALLAVQTIEFGLGMCLRETRSISKRVLKSRFSPQLSATLAPLSTVTTASRSEPVPRFADCSVSLPLFGTPSD